MLAAIENALIIFLSFFYGLFGFFSGTNKGDTTTEYKIKVNSFEAYENTLATAYPQTELYHVINDHFNSGLPEGKTAKKAVVIGYDGGRADMLTLLDNHKGGTIDTLLNEDGHLYLSYAGGKNYYYFNSQDTSTAPGWCSILTGETAEKTGVTGNGISKSNSYLTNLTTLVEDGVIDSSAFCVSWGGHFTASDSTYKYEKQYCEQKGVNVHFDKADNDDGTLAYAIDEITSGTDYVFAILEYPDHWGHTTGFGDKNPDYEQGFYQAEDAGRQIIDAIKARPTYDTEDWLIIVTSDHGGFNTAHGGFTIQERMTFICSNKELELKNDGFIY